MIYKFYVQVNKGTTRVRMNVDDDGNVASGGDGTIEKRTRWDLFQVWILTILEISWTLVFLLNQYSGWGLQIILLIYRIKLRKIIFQN